MAAADKRLIVVVEGTAALGFYWPFIFANYIEKIVRSFCGSDIPGQGGRCDNLHMQRNGVCIAKPATSGSNFQLGLVMFDSHGSYPGCVVQRSRWTKDVDSFLGWLSSISFSGRRLDDVAIAEGLSEALMMFAVPQNGYRTQQSVDGKKHCILVAAGSPYALPTPVYRPQIDNTEQGRKTEEQAESRLHDAEAVAQCFGRCSVSLSVICPKQQQKLIAVYNAGKRNPRATELLVDVKQPHFLVLIADDFMEARGALSQTGLVPNQSPINYLAPVSVLPSIPSGMSQPMQSGIPQQVQMGMQNVVMNNNSAANMSMSQQASSFLPSAQTKFVRVWEWSPDYYCIPPKVKQKQGTLSGLRHGEPAPITRLEGYRKVSASKTLMANWPPTLVIVRLISEVHMSDKRYVGRADFLVFRAMTQHAFLQQLQERKLCGVIQLPSQTLLLCVSDKACRLIGMLLPEDVTVFNPRNADQQQQQQQQQQQLQNRNADQQQQQQQLQNRNADQQQQQQQLKNQQQLLQQLMRQLQQPIHQLQQPQNPPTGDSTG